MRKSALLFLVLAVVSATGCAALKAGIRDGTKLGLSRLSVSSPLAEQFGVRTHGETIIVTNSTPYYMKVVVYDDVEVARLSPGDLARDERRWELLNPQVPVMVRFFKDKNYTEYVGVAAQVFWVYNGQPPISWIVSPWDIRWFNDEPPAVPEEVFPETDLEVHRVFFPREWWNSTAGIQIQNNMRATLHVRANGHPVAVLAPGGFKYLSAKTISDRWGQITFQITATQDGRFIGTQHYNFTVPVNAIWAYQLIVGPRDIWR